MKTPLDQMEEARTTILAAVIRAILHLKRGDSATALGILRGLLPEALVDEPAGAQPVEQ